MTDAEPSNVLCTDPVRAASTCPRIAAQRANDLHVLGVRSVLELCVGPSLPTLERAYRERGIRCFGNDVDERWRTSHPTGRWLVGDALQVPWQEDAVVFAPPLSRGCTGRREDSFPASDVRPSYHDFLNILEARRGPGVAVLVLPGRCWSVPADKATMHSVLARSWRLPRVVSVEHVPRTDGCVKYVDVIVQTDVVR